MKSNAKLGGRLEGTVRLDNRFRHGLDSKAVKRYRKLDREIRNCSEPTPEMYDLLGMALVVALDTVSRATDVTNGDSWARYCHFLSFTIVTRRFLGERAAKNFRRIMARRDLPTTSHTLPRPSPARSSEPPDPQS